VLTQIAWSQCILILVVAIGGWVIF
jgi:hypothetical protein